MKCSQKICLEPKPCKWAKQMDSGEWVFCDFPEDKPLHLKMEFKCPNIHCYLHSKFPDCGKIEWVATDEIKVYRQRTVYCYGDCRFQGGEENEWNENSLTS